MHLLLASILLAAAVLQSTYVPDRLGQCEAFGNPSRQGVVPSLFKVLASTDVSSTPQSKCHELVGIWSIEITLICLSFFAALIALEVSCTRARYPRGCARYPHGFYKYYGYAGQLERCLAPPVRFVFRYYQKQRKHRRIQPLYIDHRTRSNPSSTKGFLKLRTTNTTPFAEATFSLALLLERYPTFASISKDLHYVDMKNMLLVSRAVHNALVFTAKSYETLRKSTCDGETDIECWGCGSQVCDSCKSAGQSTAINYYQGCMLYCSKCYYLKHCHARSHAPWSSPSQWPRFSSPSQCRGHWDGWGRDHMWLCQTCALEPSKDTPWKRRRKENRRVGHTAPTDPRCAKCFKGLAGKGPRWWVCKGCDKECRSDYHPSWVD